MPEPATVLDRLAARAGHLYSLPAVAMEVLELTGNPQVDTHALKACIENDPALTAKILRVVNSSLFGLARPVSDLNQALALLGIKPLKMLVLGFSLPAGLFDEVESGVLRQYWRHTLTKAVAGRGISESLWNIPGDDAFIAGLLQDIGQLLLIQQIGEPYLKLLDRVHAEGRSLTATEAETMGFDHTELSARMLAAWGLPQALVEAVAWNHRLHESLGDHPASPLKQILHLAELMARLLADRQDGALAALLAAGHRYRQMTAVQLDDLAAEVDEKARGLADVLSLDLPEGADYRDVLARAHRRLAEVSEAVVAAIMEQQQAEAGAGPAEAGRREAERRAEFDQLSDALARVSAEPLSIVKPAAEQPSPAASMIDSPAASGSKTASETANGLPGDDGRSGRKQEHRRGRRAAEQQPSGTWTFGPTARGPAAFTRAAPSATLSETEPAEALVRHLNLAARACRQSRCPLSLLLIEPSGADDLLFAAGMDGFAGLFDQLRGACEKLGHAAAMYVPVGTSGAALVLPNCDRPEAVRHGNDLAQEVRERFDAILGDNQDQEVGVSIGAATVALPPKNFAADDLYSAAARCLYASHASGGVVKSIEIY